MAVLSVRHVTKKFGGIRAVDDCSFDIEPQSITGLIGPNGSGKTTMLNLINGFYRPDEGKIFFKDQEITHLRPCEIAQRGIGRTFQSIRVFKKMSVLENVLLPGIQLHQEWHEALQLALRALKSVDLDSLKDEFAEQLSHGQQKLLELVRTLIRAPMLVLLDEPLTGVNPVMIDRICKHLRDLPEKGKTILMIEHNLTKVMSVCDRIIVLDHGRKIAEGTPEQIQNDPNTIDAYLGG